MLAVFARRELEAQKRKEKEDEDNLLKTITLWKLKLLIEEMRRRNR